MTEEDDGDVPSGYEKRDAPKFVFQITPEELKVPNEGTLEVTVKSKEDDTYKYLIELNSCFFEIVEPRGKQDSKTQLYGILKPGEELKFRIKLRDEEKCDYFGIEPEGTITISHVRSKDNEYWKYRYESSKIVWFLLDRSGGRIAVVSKSLLIAEETEDIKHRRQKHKEHREINEKELARVIAEREKTNQEKETVEKKEAREKEKEKSKKSEKKSVKVSKVENPKESKVESKVEPKSEAKPQPKAESQYQNLDAQLPPELKNPTKLKTSGDSKNQKAVDNKKMGNIKKNKKNPCCSIL